MRISKQDCISEDKSEIFVLIQIEDKTFEFTSSEYNVLVNFIENQKLVDSLCMLQSICSGKKSFLERINDNNSLDSFINLFMWFDHKIEEIIRIQTHS